MKEKETVTDFVKHQILSTNFTLKKKKKKIMADSEESPGGRSH